MERIFAIGDIHGCSNTLDRLLRKGIKLKKNDQLYFLGDYVDRGPDSKGVIDIILDLQKDNYNVKCLRGNHEQMMMDSEIDDELFEFWMENCGGAETLNSFRIPAIEFLQPRYRQFFDNLFYYAEVNNYILVHAGLNFTNDDIFQDKEAMIWERKIRIIRKKLQGRYIIHGHTPHTLIRCQKQLADFDILRKLCIDGGCVYNEISNPGYLVAFELNTRQLIFAENSE